MLVLSRKAQEKILLGDATIVVLGVTAGRVKLGITAPDSVRILRAELAAVQPQPRMAGLPAA